jgi:hypothetical protein
MLLLQAKFYYVKFLYLFILGLENPRVSFQLTLLLDDID